MSIKRRIFQFLLIFFVSGLTVSASEAGFTLTDNTGKYMDIMQDNRIVCRYMYEYDKSSKDRLNETYKPFLHVFDPEGKGPVTKGAGGKFTHHRGIFIGWKKVSHEGTDYDRWHMKGGEQIHQKFIKKEAGSRKAMITSQVFWNDNDNKPILKEDRSMSFLPAPKGFYALIDFHTVLKADAGDLVLGGDPEHSGVQFRPADEVDTAKTIYIFPKKDPDPKKDVDYPWVGETFSLNNKKYSVVIMNHPDNPKQTKFSAYRNYGRFGAFPTASIKSKSSLTLKYRFLVAEGEMPEIKTVQECYNKFSGKKDPVPDITVQEGEQKKKKNKSGKKKKKKKESK